MRIICKQLNVEVFNGVTLLNIQRFVEVFLTALPYLLGKNKERNNTGDQTAAVYVAAV